MQPNSVDAQALGLAMQLLFKTDRKRFSIAAAYVWLWPAIRLGQLVTIEDGDGVWTGYALWAYLTPETANHLILQDPRSYRLATGTKVINSGSWISWLCQGITDAWREHSGTACALTSSKRIAWCEIRRALCLEPRLTHFGKMAEEDTLLP